jgi:hypothetical protein
MHVDCESECENYQTAMAACVHYQKMYSEMSAIAEKYRIQNEVLKEMLSDVFSTMKRQAG